MLASRLIDMDIGQYPAARGRRFAFTIAAAFAVLGAISYWRGHQSAPSIFIATTAVLGVAGLLMPERLGPLERAWMKLAHAISRITTPLFLGIVYFVVLTPIGLIRRTFGTNPMVHRADRGSYWISRPAPDRDSVRQRMERQF